MSRARTLANFVGGTSTISGTPTFTGTVSGAGAMEHLSSTTVANSAQFVVFDNLSTDYDTFQFQFDLHPASDNATFSLQFLDSSGTVINGADDYGCYADFDGTAVTDDDQNHITLSSADIGAASHEGIRGWFNLLGRNFAVATDRLAPQISGFIYGQYNTGVYSGGTVIGALNNANVQAIRGLRFVVNSGNIEAGRVDLFGIRST